MRFFCGTAVEMDVSLGFGTLRRYGKLLTSLQNGWLLEGSYHPLSVVTSWELRSICLVSPKEMDPLSAYIGPDAHSQYGPTIHDIDGSSCVRFYQHRTKALSS